MRESRVYTGVPPLTSRERDGLSLMWFRDKLRPTVRRQVTVVVAIEHVCIVDHLLPDGGGGPELGQPIATELAEQVIRVRDGAANRSRVRAMREVQLGRDELMRQDHARIAPGRGVKSARSLACV